MIRVVQLAPGVPSLHCADCWQRMRTYLICRDNRFRCVYCWKRCERNA